MHGPILKRNHHAVHYRCDCCTLEIATHDTPASPTERFAADHFLQSYSHISVNRGRS